MEVKFRTYINEFSLANKICRVCWHIVQALLFSTTPPFAMNGWRCMILRLFGAKIGKKVVIRPSVKVWAPWNLEIADYCAIDDAVFLYNVGKVVLESHVIVSREAFVCTASHNIRSKGMELTTKPIHLRQDCWVCARATILPGVVIGEGTVIGSGAVVSRSVDDWIVVAGNPARTVSRRALEA